MPTQLSGCAVFARVKGRIIAGRSWKVLQEEWYLQLHQSGNTHTHKRTGKDSTQAHIILSECRKSKQPRTVPLDRWRVNREEEGTEHMPTPLRGSVKSEAERTNFSAQLEEWKQSTITKNPMKKKQRSPSTPHRNVIIKVSSSNKTYPISEKTLSRPAHTFPVPVPVCRRMSAVAMQTFRQNCSKILISCLLTAHAATVLGRWLCPGHSGHSGRSGDASLPKSAWCTYPPWGCLWKRKWTCINFVQVQVIRLISSNLASTGSSSGSGTQILSKTSVLWMSFFAFEIFEAV